MKKIFWIAAAVAGVLTAASCQKESLTGAKGDTGMVTLSVQIPEDLQTKAISQAVKTDIVYYEIWNSDWDTKLYPVNAGELASAKVVNKEALLELVLISDQTYNFIFWAQKETCDAYDVNELKAVKINYDVIAENGNSDDFDAYYAVKTIELRGSIKETVTLYRPFAQLNFGSSKMQSLFGEVSLDASAITVSDLATTFNTVKGIGEGARETVTFEADAIIDEPLVVGTDTYTWITMDYMLMHGLQSTVNVAASFEVGMDNPVEHTISNVPLKKNYRTNILGELFTAGADLKVVIDPAFLKPEQGITVGIPEEPQYNEETMTYSIKTAGNVLWLASQPKDFAAAKKISFDADIDMMGQGINPIYTSSASKSSSQILGNGHTVKNFTVTAKGKLAAGLFGVHKGSISDLHIADAVINGEYMTGALVGSVYGSVTNCYATNVTVTSVPYAVNGGFDGGNHVGALVGYAAENGNGTYNYTGNVVDGATVTGYRDLGGLIGTLQYGVDVNANQIKNVTVLVDQYTNYYGDKTANIGEIAGRLSSDSRFIAPHDNTVENVNLYLPEWTMVDGLLTMSLPGNLTLFNGATFCDNRDVDQAYVVDGNGSTVKFVADDASDLDVQTKYTPFTSKNGENVTVKDITFTGEFSFLTAGYYHEATDPNYGPHPTFHTTLENVNIIDAKVMPIVVHQALFCDGITIMNNCNIYGTTKSQYSASSAAVLDVVTFNHSQTFLNGGIYGVVGTHPNFAQAAMTIDGAEVDVVENYYYLTSNNASQTYRGLYVKSGSEINVINTYTTKANRFAHIEIEDGANVDVLTFDSFSLNHANFTSEWIKIADGTVNKVIANGTEYTLAEFKAAYNL